MDLGIKGRIALVLGAGGGLGRAIAMALSREGACVVLADIDEAALALTRRAVADSDGIAMPLIWNVADQGAIDRQFESIEQHFGTVGILINNTGGPPPTGATGVGADVWSAQFKAMVLSIIKITDRALSAMREAGWGRIVTSTSSGVLAPIPGLAISNALRLSLVGWSKSLAREVAPSGITANVILPGRIATDRIRVLDEAKAEREGRKVTDVVAESTGAIPVGRYGTPEEYADAVAFLASGPASYITGSVLRVDGGYVQSI